MEAELGLLQRPTKPLLGREYPCHVDVGVCRGMGQNNTLPMDVVVAASLFLSETDLHRLFLVNKDIWPRYIMDKRVWAERLVLKYGFSVQYSSHSYASLYKCCVEDYCYYSPLKLTHTSHRLFNGEICSCLSMFQGPICGTVFAGGHDGSVYQLNYSTNDAQNHWQAKQLRLENTTFCGGDTWVHALENVGNRVLAVGKGKYMIIHIPNASAMNALQSYDCDAYTLVAHTGAIHDIKSFGSSMCVTTSFDGTSKLWNLEQRECVGEFLGHQNQVYSVCTCHEKHLVLSASYDHRIHVYDTRLANRIPIISYDHGRPAWYMKPKTLQDVSDLNVFLSSCSDGKIREWDLRSNSRTPIAEYVNGFNDCPCNSFDISYFNSTLVCGYDDGRLSLFNMENQELIFTKQTTSRYIRKVAILSFMGGKLSKYLYGTNDGTIGVVNYCNSGYATEKCAELTRICSGVRALAVCSSAVHGEKEIVYGGTSGEVGFIRPVPLHLR